jgi:hypothetical protein
MPVHVPFFLLQLLYLQVKRHCEAMYYLKRGSGHIYGMIITSQREVHPT